MGSYDNQTTYEYNGKLIGVDNCILEEIKFLQFVGVKTIASCCGHNKIYGEVIVDMRSIDLMLQLGYENTNENREDIFYTKSFS